MFIIVLPLFRCCLQIFTPPQQTLWPLASPPSLTRFLTNDSDSVQKLHYLPQNHTVHVINWMPDLENEKAAATGKNPSADLCPPTPSPEDVAMEDDTNAPATTRAQGRKRKAGNLVENRPIRQSPRLNPTTDQNEDPVPQPPAAHTQHAKAAPTVGKSAPPKKTAGITGVQKAVHEAQEQARKEAERRGSMWGRIAKAVDGAMEAKAPEQIERQHMDHIVNAILECALLKLPSAKKPSQNHLRKEKDKEQEESQEVHSTGEAAQPSKSPNPWANVAAKKANPEIGKPTLAAPLKGVRPDERLMVRLGKDSPHRTEHPFVLQKKANAVLPSKTVIGKVAHINSGIALIPAPGTTIAQLKEHKETLARIFGACRAERNEKWAKYLVRGVPRRIRTLETLEDVTPEIAAEAFQQSCNMQPEWARWLIPQGVEEEDLVEVSMIFAVRPSNIQRIPKVISFLSEMHVIVALPARETPIQCTQCGEWSHKKDNCAKRTWCFYCSSDKLLVESHHYQEEECQDESQSCPHPPKCIVCNDPHNTDYTDCPLKSSYFKAKDALIKATAAKATQIRGQQKVLKNRLIRDNRY